MEPDSDPELSPHVAIPIQETSRPTQPEESEEPEVITVESDSEEIMVPLQYDLEDVTLVNSPADCAE
jgi:hypothetical protein